MRIKMYWEKKNSFWRKNKKKKLQTSEKCRQLITRKITALKDLFLSERKKNFLNYWENAWAIQRNGRNY